MMQSTDTLNLDFPKYWSIVKRRWLPAMAILGSVATLSAVLAMSQKPDYQATGKLLLKSDRTSSLTGMGQQIGELNALTQKSNPLNTEIEIIRSLPLLEQALKELKLKDESGVPLLPQAIAKQIDIKNIGSTDVLEISYKTDDPETAAALVNKLMALYIEKNLRTNRAEAVAAGEFIAQELPKAEASVQEAEAALRLFKEQNQVADLSEEAKTAMAQVKNLETQITETKAELAALKSQSANLEGKLNMTSEEAVEINTLNQSSGVQSLLEEYQKVEAELAAQSTYFLDTSPTIMALKMKRDSLKALLESRVNDSLGEEKPFSTRNLQIGESQQRLIEDFARLEVEEVGLANKIALLSNAYEAQVQRVNLLPKLEEEQRQLQRKLEAAQSTYQTLLQKLQEVQVLENQNIGNASIIEPALVPEKPSRRKPILILALGSLLSLFMAGATIIILELRDTSIKTLKEAKEFFGYTLLGAIPYASQKARRRSQVSDRGIPQVTVRTDSHSPISDAYRMLQANLKFTSSDKALQVIVVTSSSEREGKSTVASNLAAATAELGQRVLLVDADLRNPIQHHIWNLTNAAGLSDVLVAQAEFEATVAPHVIPNLDVLTSGVLPPNPMALLDSKRMAALIQYFANRYDFIIFDTPSVTQAPDAVTLGKMTDGVLYVARPGVLDSTNARTAKDLLAHSEQHILGLVVNGLLFKNEPDSYFYFAKRYPDEAKSLTHELKRLAHRTLADRN